MWTLKVYKTNIFRELNPFVWLLVWSQKHPKASSQEMLTEAKIHMGLVQRYAAFDFLIISIKVSIFVKLYPFTL